MEDRWRVGYLALIMSTTADIILIGHGSGDALQLTLQAQGVLQRHGFALAVGVSPRLERVLASSKVDLEHLDERMLAVGDPADSLLIAADAILKQTEVERPVIVLMPGNPLFLNSLSRLLVAEGAGRKLTVQRIAGVSQLDLAINELGIDVAARGLQVFDAAAVARGRTRPDPAIPALLFRASDLLTNDQSPLEALHSLLRELYPGTHPVTLFNVDPASDATSFATTTVADFAGFAEHLHDGSSLYLSRVRS